MIAVSTCTTTHHPRSDLDTAWQEGNGWVGSLCVELGDLKAEGESQEIVQDVIMARLWRAVQPFYPAETWKSQKYRRIPLEFAGEEIEFHGCSELKSCSKGFQHPERNSHYQECQWPLSSPRFGQNYISNLLFSSPIFPILRTLVLYSIRIKITPRIQWFVSTIIHFQVRDSVLDDNLSQKYNHIEVIIVTLETCQNFATRGKLVAALLYFPMRRITGKTTDEFTGYNFLLMNDEPSRERVW